MTMDSTEVGRYGTLRLMKRQEPHKVVASYPIDDEEITFGRDPSCSIRLYYESVSALHCKISIHNLDCCMACIASQLPCQLCCRGRAQ